MSEGHDWQPDTYARSSVGIARPIWRCSKCGAGQFRTEGPPPPADAILKVDRGRVVELKSSRSRSERFAYFNCEEWMVQQVCDL